MKRIVAAVAFAVIGASSIASAADMAVKLPGRRRRSCLQLERLLRGSKRRRCLDQVGGDL
jgi:hypothetical protein